MSLLQEITDKGATTSWCPIKGCGSLLALGSKDGAGGQTFDDYGGEIAVYSLDYAAGQPKLLGKADTTSRFNCLAWGKKGPQRMGIIAGGMQNGAISVWDPSSLSTPLATIEKHKSTVNSLEFNPHPGTEQLLATGASDNEVYIVDLNKPNMPNVYSPAGPGCQKHSGEVRTVAWNTEVVHVLATAGLDGSCTVWSLKAKKPWAEIRDPSGAGFSAVAWSPSQGLHLLTASVNDRDPVIRLWDVRSSTTNPLAEYRGHTAGIFSLSWCPSDPSYVLSCAKDNRTLLWDLYSGKPVYELPHVEDHHNHASGGYRPGLDGANGFGGNAGGAAAAFGDSPGAGGAAAAFGGARTSTLGGGSSGRRYQIQFSPHDRTVFSACSFDRKVQVYSLYGGGVNASRSAANGNYALRAPSWSKRPCSGVFGFGGRLVNFGTPSKQPQPDQPPVVAGRVRLSSVVDDEKLVQDCVDWDNKLTQALEMANQYRQQQNYSDQNAQDGSSNPYLVDLCNAMAEQATTEEEKAAWNCLKIPFAPCSRDEILLQLGYNLDSINQLISSLDKRALAEEETKAREEQERQQQQMQMEQEQLQQQQQMQQMQDQMQQMGFDPNQQQYQQYDNQQQQQQQPPFGAAQMPPQQQQYGGGQMSPQQQQTGGMAMNGFGQQNAFDGTASGSAFDAFESDAPQEDQYIDDQQGEGEEEMHQQEQEETTEEDASQDQLEHVENKQEEPEQAESPAAPSLVSKKKPTMQDVTLEDAEFADPNVEDIVRKSLLIGNFPVAVDCCLENNRFADALLLASCAGGQLWQETLEKYLNRFFTKKAYVPVLSGVITEDYDSYVRRADISGDKWKEVIGIFSRYGKSAEIPSLCETLAERLETERAGDEEAAVGACICYIVAKNVEKTVNIFVRQGIAKAMQYITGGGVELSQSIVQKVSVYQQALPGSSTHSGVPCVMEHFLNYAEALAGQGMLDYAAKYISELDTSMLSTDGGYHDNNNYGGGEYEMKHNEQAKRALELVDRIWGAHPDPAGSLIQFIPTRPIAFEMVDIGVAPTGGAAGYGTPEMHPQAASNMYGGGAQPSLNSYQSNTSTGSSFHQPTQPQQQPQYGGAPAQPQGYGQPQPPQQQTGYGQPGFAAPAPPAQQYNAPPNMNMGPGGYAPQQHQQAPVPQPSASFNKPAPSLPQAPQAANTNASRPKGFIKENDGFGSTAGNPAAGMKYGNLQGAAAKTPFAAAQPVQGGAGMNNTGVWNPSQGQAPQGYGQVPSTPPQQQMQQQQPEPVKKVMPPQMVPIMQQLDHFMVQLGSRCTSTMDKRKHAESLKSIAALKDHLMTGKVEDALFPEIQQLLQLMISGDFQGANNIRTSLTSRAHVWTEQREWLKGMTTLINLAKQ